MSRPEKIGFHAIEVYLPNYYAELSDMEKHAHIPTGKVTIGIGQLQIGYCSDIEDPVSMALTALDRLMRKNNIGYERVGHLGVGTETLTDKSKAMKTSLLKLWEQNGVEALNVEGVDTMNACYGGTAALLNAMNWMESSVYDGRYAVVVATDVSTYDDPMARTASGAGAVAMLIGPDAPLYFETGIRSTFMSHAFDFYKPHHGTLYPIYDTMITNTCFYNALDKCYDDVCNKQEAKGVKDKTSGTFGLDCIDFFAFHTPYSKLVQKAFGRIKARDALRATEPGALTEDMKKLRNGIYKNGTFNRPDEKLSMAVSEKEFESKTEPCLYVSRRLGNTYTAAAYIGLASLLSRVSLDEISGGKRVGLFSFGSGLAATLFMLKTQDKEKVRKLKNSVPDFASSLAKRQRLSAEKIDKMVQASGLVKIHPYELTGSVDELKAGTWYIKEVDCFYRRTYERKEN